jgi:AcrR family transcriptional regulator
MSPRTEAQNEQLRAESRARIITSALELFAQHGYEQTSVRMIAQAAGVAQGLLYNYFAGKEGLLRAIFEQSMADVRESFAAAEQAAQPDQRIAQLIQAAFTTIRRNVAFWRLSYGVRMQAGVLASLGEGMSGWADSIRQTFERYFGETGAPDPPVEAAILFALIDGVCQHYVLDPQRYPLDRVEEALIQRYSKT